MSSTTFSGPLTVLNGPLTIGAAVLTEAQIENLEALSTTELAALDGITPGTAYASKALVLNSSKGISTITSATITTMTGNVVGNVTGDLTGNVTGNVTGNISGAVTASSLTLVATVLGSTAPEIDVQCDVSANTETINTAAAVSVTKRLTKIDNTVGGMGAITLAAPDVSMLGVVKIITMTVDGGDLTLSLANVTGGSAATTATFDAVDDTLILVGGVNKWHVIGEAGVALT